MLTTDIFKLFGSQRESEDALIEEQTRLRALETNALTTGKPEYDSLFMNHLQVNLPEPQWQQHQIYSTIRGEMQRMLPQAPAENHQQED